MKVSAWLRRLLPILAIVGLVAGPFTVPMEGVAMAAAALSAMPDDMPCCPDEKPAVPDCPKDCPLMAACIAKCFSIEPMLLGSAVVLRAGDPALHRGGDVAGDALAVEPTARPPRT